MKKILEMLAIIFFILIFAGWVFIAYVNRGLREAVIVAVFITLFIFVLSVVDRRDDS